MIKEGLEALERIIGCSTIESHTKKWQQDYYTVEKELKALEIIKEKPQATLWLFQYCDKEMEYEDMIFLFKEDITKEQFDLLKEVLI